jgi:hypothetical protein
MSHATQKPVRTLRSDLRALRHLAGSRKVAETLTALWLTATFAVLLVVVMALGGAR